jgi:hypothetical protein
MRGNYTFFSSLPHTGHSLNINYSHILSPGLKCRLTLTVELLQVHSLGQLSSQREMGKRLWMPCASGPLLRCRRPRREHTSPLVGSGYGVGRDWEHKDCRRKAALASHTRLISVTHASLFSKHLQIMASLVNSSQQST